MPVFSFFHYSKEHGKTLNKTGPVVAVEVGIPAALKQYLGEKGLPIPPAVPGLALVDTGAFATAVDESIFVQLGVSPIDEMTTESPHGPAKSNIYPASISFPAMNLTNMAMERVVGSSLKWQTDDGKEIIMLMGRDLLQYFVLIYNGPSSDLTLCY